jgi:CDP-paratose 2-epimerase
MKEEHSKQRANGRNGHAFSRNGIRKSGNCLKTNHRPVSIRNGGSEKLVLITGGAGFIGTNLADYLLRTGKKVLIFDNLSRAGVEQNLKWLQANHKSRVQFQKGDILNRRAIEKAVAQASHIFHFAAQVAVTTSLINPIEDFEINARGTLNLLEAIRAQPMPPSVIYTSTNKVYGDMADVKLESVKGRYEPANELCRKSGFDEERSLAFHSPYGCSKGAACQYVLDYSRTFGVRTAVFRMSCIYGPHQFGNEDQGWVAHFLIKALRGDPITIYGDGRQVRDILFVEDLVNAFMLAWANIEDISGQAFNMGGGPSNTISLLELLEVISELRGHSIPVEFSDWRTADQRYYVSDTRKFSAATGWRPRINVRQGIGRLYRWLQEFGPISRKPSQSREMAMTEFVAG